MTGKITLALAGAAALIGACGAVAADAQQVTRTTTTTTVRRTGPAYGYRYHHRRVCRTRWFHHRRVTRCYYR